MGVVASTDRVHMMSQGPRVPLSLMPRLPGMEMEEGHSLLLREPEVPRSPALGQVGMQLKLSTVRKLWPDPIAALPASPSVGPAQGRGAAREALGREEPWRRC